MVIRQTVEYIRNLLNNRHTEHFSTYKLWRKFKYYRERPNNNKKRGCQKSLERIDSIS